jgi:hypothetical protein
MSAGPYVAAARPLSAKSKASVRSKRTNAVAQQFRERLEAAEAALKTDSFSGSVWRCRLTPG